MANDTTIRISAIDATTEAFRSIQGNIGRLQNSIKGVAGPLAAAFSVAAISAFTKSLIDAANELQDVSDRTGVAAEKLSALGNAATLNGSSQEELNNAISKLSKSIAEASTGAGAQAEAFKALGISVKDANGNIRPTTDILNDVSNAFARAEDGAVKVKIAQDLLGRSGTNLIPLLNQGATAINSYAATFDDEFIRQSAEFNDNLDKLIIRFKTLAATIAGPVVAALNKVFEFFEEGGEDKKTGKFIEGTDLLTNRLKGLKGELNKFSANDVALLGQVTGGLAPKTKLKLPTKANEEVADFQTFSEAAGIRIFEMDYKALSQEVGDFVTFQEAVNEKVKEFDYQNFIKEQEELNKVVEMSKITMKDFGERSVLSIEDALMDLVQGTKTAKEAFGDMAKSIIADLLRMYIRAQITVPIFNALFGTQAPAPIVTATGVPTGRAIGGPVQAGTPYMVGERGPELFVPARSGSIVPNDQMGGGSVVIQQTINVTTGVQQTVRTEIAALLPQISEAAKAAVLDAKKRGGSFSAAFA